jgi:peptidoglycan/LPS O-acetylase OafA/YrhL
LLQLDGLRALAISLVFIHHAFKVPLLWLGVDIFFVLSGFLINGILMDRKERGLSYFSYFYSRRVRRILPPYALLLIFVSLVFGLAWTHYWYWFLFLANIGAIRQELGLLSQLDPLWSLAVEEQFYLVWPFAVLFLSRRNLLRFSIALVVLVPFLRALCTPLFPTHFYIYYLLPFRVDLLASGAALSILWRDHRDRLLSFVPIAKWMPLVSVLLLLGLSRYPVFRTKNNTPIGNAVIYELTLAIAVGFLVWSLGPRGLLRRMLESAIARTLGIISYTFYLVHAAMLTLGDAWHLNTLTTAALALALSLVYAIASWYAMERWLIHGPPLPLFEKES